MQTRTLHTSLSVSNYSKKYWPSTNFKGYGLGFSLSDYHGTKIVNHGGGSDGMISKVVLVPEEKVGFVILTNSINDLPSALSYYILDHYFGKEEKDWSTIYYGFYVDGQKRAQKAKEKGIETIVFDRGGYAYHGRVKILAESLRKGGIKF